LKLNHIDLQISDVDAAREFFERYYPRDFHVGFVLESASDVREVYKRLKAGGVGIKMDLREGGPHLLFVCEGPDAIPVEVRAPRGN
jgi:lactoylglutathione lyase